MVDFLKNVQSMPQKIPRVLVNQFAQNVHLNSSKKMEMMISMDSMIKLNKPTFKNAVHINSGRHRPAPPHLLPR